MLTQEVVAVRKTALYDEHVARGAKIVEFAGWAMPMLYSGIVREHRRVRSTAGLFDVSHMGEFVVSGADALAALERLTTNRLSAATEGRVQYTAMCYENGGFVDDLLIYAMPGRYMLVVNAANREKDLEWIRSNLTGDAAVADVSNETGLIALQGPASEGILAGLTSSDLGTLRYYHWMTAEVAGHEATLSRTGYTGEDGFEIYCEPEDAPAIWSALMEEGSSVDIEPVGLGARDTLRLEMGYSLYGSEMDESRTPAEAGLMWITKLSKGEFIGRDAIAKKVDEGVRERVVGFELTAGGVPRRGHRIFVGDEEVGHVTSGTFSPSLSRGVGLGYVRSDVNGELSIEIRDKRIEGRMVFLPFYREGSARRNR
ncbi:MAG: glycine cleavage system aminomethyltransferase GcvT [Candidatus Eisenbacteria bacterium]